MFSNFQQVLCIVCLFPTDVCTSNCSVMNFTVLYYLLNRKCLILLWTRGHHFKWKSLFPNNSYLVSMVSKMIFPRKVSLSLCQSVHLSRNITSCPVMSRPKSHQNRKFYWTKLSDVFQGWQKYIQSHNDATAVLGKAKLTGILWPASRHTSKFHHGHWSRCWVRSPP